MVLKWYAHHAQLAEPIQRNFKLPSYPAANVALENSAEWIARRVTIVKRADSARLLASRRAVRPATPDVQRTDGTDARVGVHCLRWGKRRSWPPPASDSVNMPSRVQTMVAQSMRALDAGKVTEEMPVSMHPAGRKICCAKPHAMHGLPHRARQ